MTGFIWFALGLVGGIFGQMCLWVDDEAGCGWGDYFRHRKHQSRHGLDLLFSVAFWTAWGSGLLTTFASVFGPRAEELMAKLPKTPAGVGCFVIGLAVCMASRRIVKRFFPEVGEAEAPPTHPKGD